MIPRRKKKWWQRKRLLRTKIRSNCSMRIVIAISKEI